MAQLTIQVRPEVLIPPVVDAGPNLTVTLPESQVNVSMIATDSDGVIVARQWSVVSSTMLIVPVIQNPTATTTLVTNLSAGTLTLQAKATDNDGQTATDTMTITVEEAINELPIAVSDGPYVVNIGANSETRIAIDNDAMTEPSSGIYELILTAENPDTAIFGYDAADIDAIADPDELSFWFQDHATPTQLLPANFESYNNITRAIRFSFTGLIPEFVPATDSSNLRLYAKVKGIDITGLGSSDPDGTIASYAWSFVTSPGLITIENSALPTTRILNIGQTGVYNLQLQVTDNDGGVGISGTTLSVVNGGFGSAAAITGISAGDNGSGVVTSTVGASVGMTGTLTISGSPISTAIIWSVVGAPPGAILPTITDGDTLTPTFEFPAGAELGEYTVAITGIVDDVLVDSATATITIAAGGLQIETTGSFEIGDDIEFVMRIFGGLPNEEVDVRFSLSDQVIVEAVSYATVLFGDPQQTDIFSPGLSYTDKTITLDGTGQFVFLHRIFIPIPSSGTTTLYLTSTITGATSTISEPSSVTVEHSNSAS